MFLSTFLHQIFSQLCFYLKDLIKIVRLLLCCHTQYIPLSDAISDLSLLSGEILLLAFMQDFYLIHTQRGQKRPDDFGYNSLTKAFFWKIFDGEMLIRSQTTTLLQIFCHICILFLSYFKKADSSRRLSRGTLCMNGLTA